MLASRYYGTYTNPLSLAPRHLHARRELALPSTPRGVATSRSLDLHVRRLLAYDPGLTATEPATDARGLRRAGRLIEGISGLLYGQGTTTYSKGNPLVSNDRAKGSFVLLYPGRNGPIASARLEVLREGIEDWEILNVVRHKHGAAAVRKLPLAVSSRHGQGRQARLHHRLPERTSTPYSWPTYSRHAGTPRTVASMRAAALRAAS